MHVHDEHEEFQPSPEHMASLLFGVYRTHPEQLDFSLRENEGHDLIVAGRRVDAKAAMRQADGSWRFRLPIMRPSFYGQHCYPKDYAADCEVLALVALYPGGEPADVYLLESAGAPRNLRIERGGAHRHLEEAWQVFRSAPKALQA